jgi:hypothetical protein
MRIFEGKVYFQSKKQEDYKRKGDFHESHNINEQMFFMLDQFVQHLER